EALPLHQGLHRLPPDGPLRPEGGPAQGRAARVPRRPDQGPQGAGGAAAGRPVRSDRLVQGEGVAVGGVHPGPEGGPRGVGVADDVFARMKGERKSAVRFRHCSANGVHEASDKRRTPQSLFPAAFLLCRFWWNEITKISCATVTLPGSEYGPLYQPVRGFSTP